jgi:hypothetical protein
LNAGVDEAICIFDRSISAEIPRVRFREIAGTVRLPLLQCLDLCIRLRDAMCDPYQQVGKLLL